MASNAIEIHFRSTEIGGGGGEGHHNGQPVNHSRIYTNSNLPVVFQRTMDGLMADLI